MLMCHADGLSELRSLKDQLHADPEELEDDFQLDSSEQILYTASFEELVRSNLRYDTIIWVSISLLLVLAWGVGVIMLLYLPIRRYILQKDISSRKLYVTPSEIVYKVLRPSFMPFWGIITIEKHVPLSKVIDIIIEQDADGSFRRIIYVCFTGWLQSNYGIHTFRTESIAHGKAARVDELQVQGVANPAILRKVIVREAAKAIQDVGKCWKLSTVTGELETMSRMTSLTGGQPILKSPAKSWKMTASPHHSSVERRTVVPGELFMQKLDEVNKSVKVCTISLLLIVLIKELKAYFVPRIRSQPRNELLLPLRKLSYSWRNPKRPQKVVEMP
ncbi:uncharacterized protein LOC111313309 isoform X2 [Durio zibethinus]|uniref:Uncharacterized protein LOC111313309 isoform X2 n=1 Tax=Durio zibethinus TaxID=66656 RepID=A0A6P6AY61_DURZI|nr:uncharacterized protein LOC111313309 isoform X2 [Durio zibethinus]